MRAMLTTLIFSAATVLAQQEEPANPARMIWIDKLVIESNTLPDEDRLGLERCFEHHSYSQPELQERIRGATRDLGYFQAVVDQPKIAAAGQKNKCEKVEVAVNVNEGLRYQVGQVGFAGGSAFSPLQMQEAFSVHQGDTFRPIQIARGLEALRNLYSNQGYVNIVANPVAKIDNAARVIHLRIEVDEGSVFNIGDLILDGVEAHPGAAAALQESWTELRGRRFDPRLLDHWLQTNQANCPGCTRSRDIDLAGVQPGTVNVRLSLYNKHWSARQSSALIAAPTRRDSYCTSPPVRVLR
jgi:hypothetical protein